MKKIIVLAVLPAALSLTSAAHAEAGVSGSLGTTGIGLHLTLPLKEQLNVRLGVNALNYSYDGSTTDLDYDLKLKLRTVDALLDYYPMNGNFRVSGGIVYNGNKLTGNARSNAAGNYTLNGTVYSAASAGTLDAQVDFRKVAPYLGIGFGNAIAKDKGWGFSADLGVLFQGTPNTSITNSGCTAPAPVCTQLASDIAAENRSLRDDVHDFKAYPVLRVGLSYKF